MGFKLAGRLPLVGAVTALLVAGLTVAVAGAAPGKGGASLSKEQRASAS